MTSPSLATHNGTITVENPATGQHRTFRIATIRKGKLKGRRLVELQIGPDNEHDYQAFAFVVQGKVVVWKRFRVGPVYLTYARILELPEEFERRGLRYLWAATCRRCNRKLTTPESIEAGIGPECEKVEEEKESR